MNAEEEIARRFLGSLGISDERIEYEPQGPSKFPDFCIDNMIGVEVRRLNRNFERNGNSSYEGVELLSHRLEDWLHGRMPDLYTQEEGPAWYVCVSFSRQEQCANVKSEYNKLRFRIQSALDSFEDGGAPIGEQKVLISGADLTLRVWKSSNHFKSKFVLGSMNDLDVGGFVYAELTRNIEIAVREKSVIVAKNEVSYRNWWLVLVNRMTPVINGPELINAWHDVEIEHPFERILVVNELSRLSYVELLKEKGAR